MGAPGASQGSTALAIPAPRWSSAPATPAVRYITRKSRDPIRASSRGPKKYSPIMLKRMCMKPPCRNMYVTTPHGCWRIHAGWNVRTWYSGDPRGTTRNATMLAMSSRRTQGVIGFPSNGGTDPEAVQRKSRDAGRQPAWPAPGGSG